MCFKFLVLVYLQLKMLICLFTKHTLFKIESAVLLLMILIRLVLSRNFGNIMHDTAPNYIDINVRELQKLEKLHIKRNKPQLDINFSINCKNCFVFSKFINVNLPNVD